MVQSGLSPFKDASQRCSNLDREVEVGKPDTGADHWRPPALIERRPSSRELRLVPKGCGRVKRLLEDDLASVGVASGQEGIAVESDRLNQGAERAVGLQIEEYEEQRGSVTRDINLFESYLYGGVASARITLHLKRHKAGNAVGNRPRRAFKQREGRLITADPVRDDAGGRRPLERGQHDGSSRRVEEGALARPPRPLDPVGGHESGQG